jgi:hypothetical protein
MKINNPFGEFEEKEQWIIFLASVIVGILTSIGAKKGLGLLLSIALGLVISLVGYASALLHRKLSSLADRIDLQIRKADKERQQIAEILEEIIMWAKDDSMISKIRKSLNGVKQILTLKGIEEGIVRNTLLTPLMQSEWNKVISTSMYSLPGEWMDPYWFSFLTLQIARAAELKHKNPIAKRYFIYERDVVRDYKDEIKLLIEAHNNYIRPFLYFAEDIKNKNVTLLDFLYIQLCDNSEIFFLRNFEKSGEVEEVKDDITKGNLKQFMDFLNTQETSLDRKGALN